ncbi:MAG: SpaA isopeptide-forming pilin-related protein, partial [Oscillospiraceae bacterium]
PYVILVKAGPTDAVLKGYFDENKTTSNIKNNAVIKAEKTALADDYEEFSITGKILNKNFTATKDGNGADQYVTWSVDYTPCELEHTGENLHLEDKIPEGLDLRADSKGKIIVKDNIKAEKLTLNADGSYTGSKNFIDLPKTVLSYNSDTRILSFTMPDKKQAYRLTYITEITGEAGKLTNAVRLVGDTVYAPTEGKKEYEVSTASASASLTRSGWLMINKQNEKSTALAGAEFTLYAEDGTTVIRQGVSKADGKLYLKIIPEGEYKLQETKAPTGYTPDTTVHTVKVEKQSDGKLQTTIDGTPGNEITLKNYKPGTVGNLTISTKVEGNAASKTKQFEFTFKLGDGKDTATEYSYIGKGVPNGKIKSGGTFKLADSQSITIQNLPKDKAYEISEIDSKGQNCC